MDLWNGILSSVGFAIRSTFHTTRQASPRQLVFGRDMIWNVKYIANWDKIKAQGRKQMITNNEKVNKTR